ncbi:2,3-diaminopropionate biosynthesis protein SbnA [Psychroflexus montanilacus]|uniref:2,3-diaminopropionate biosynthesis protein SbnA n=1 Tax=Psychroflexus montanilacus TaxID=2873598 RepID=UPI001CCDCB6A|nr:2,3-diaminopropionate biosynthesis protein SbnA [Psychroflexus montanilacus]MBZ9650917.1 2,3-diaminopropionate biosynthesis protein SbnA [Psychroflexus montanilacus]
MKATETALKTPKYRSNILSSIGHTPLIRLARFSSQMECHVYGKMESFNPGGSIKDRTALNMLSKAMESGEVEPGDTIIESSSGNMALGLAQACKFYNINLIIVHDPKLNNHSKKILLTYGVKLVKVDQPKTKGGYLESRIQKVNELLDKFPHSYCLNQYQNAANPQTHLQTMKEITEALNQHVDYIFISTSTCGTLMGCALYIYKNNLKTKIIAVDALGSITFGKKESKRLIPGHGSGKPSNFLDLAYIHDVVHVSDEDSVQGCWKLLEKEAILCGGSSGAVISAIERYAPKIEARAQCVAILCDRGERYLDTIFNKKWIVQHFPDFVFPKEQIQEKVK